MSDLLPPSSSQLERAIAQSTGLQQLDPALIAQLWNPATCPAQALPWLAWALSVDRWDDAWPESRQRAAIAGSIAWHRKKGTPWAVEQALAAVGYEASRLIEYQELHQAWTDAGGDTLDGAGTLDGSSTLSAPGGDFRFTARSWAEYAVRLNIGEVSWSRARQREAVAICNAYAPARSQLVALIIAALIGFNARITLADINVRARVRLAACRRFDVGRFDTLDGCDLIGGQNTPDSLDGRDTLDGLGSLSGYRPTGEPLDAGHMAIRVGGCIRLPAFTSGGNTEEPPETLDGGQLLDGRYTIAGETLDGTSTLDGPGALHYPTLITADDTLDGTNALGLRLGPPHIHHSGIIRIRRGSLVTQEPLQ